MPAIDWDQVVEVLVQWGVLLGKAEGTEGVKLAFDEQGISIPFPQMDVHMERVA